jgi:hypothetical protein
VPDINYEGVMEFVRRIFSSKLIKQGGLALIVFFTLKGLFYLALIGAGYYYTQM